MSPPPPSSIPSNGDNGTAAMLSSDNFSLRDLLYWNLFHQQKPQRQRNNEGSKKKVDNDDDDNDDDDDMYDNNWILICNGSYKKYFDWIPIHLRIGSWSIIAIWYFRILWYCAILLLINDIYYNHPNNRNNDDEVVILSDTIVVNTEHICSVSYNDDDDDDDDTTNITSRQQQQEYCSNNTLTHNSRSTSSSFVKILHYIIQRYWKHNANIILQMSSVDIQSSSFYYHTIVTIYMVYISYSIIVYSPMSYGAYITYTVQSWTLLLVRHLLYTLSGLFDNDNNNNIQNVNHNNTFVILAELIRFPCAVAHTITFIIWNFILMPYIICITFKDDPIKRHDFIRFCTSFRLLNLHGMNILFCIGTVWYFNSTTTTTTTNRSFEMADLYLSGISALFYFTFYLCILDRIGIHLYPIFSPRHSNIIVFIVWTSVILLYIVTYHVWQFIIQSY